jgi:hypothetical protein
MRLFRINGEEEFTEYKEQRFKTEHNKKVLEVWLEKNSEAIVEDGKLFVIGRQVATSFGSFIDLLALDRTGNSVVIELKRDRTPRDTLAQALEYASFIEKVDYEELEQIFQKYTQENQALTEAHKNFYNLSEEEGVSFNKDQRIVIVGYDISPEVRETATFLSKKKVRVNCIEFNYFQTNSGEQLLSHNIVVGNEAAIDKAITTASLPKTNRKQFLESLDESGRRIFSELLKVSDENRYPINWGSKGFSMNVDLNGTKVQLFTGYPPYSGTKQCIYTGFYYVESKVKNGQEISKLFRERFVKTGLFNPTGSGIDLKTLIQSPWSDQQISEIKEIFIELAKEIQKNGLKQ